MTVTNEALQEANWHGYQSARRDEVIRCIEILDQPVARQRPNAAWAALPLGLSADDTIERLARLPVEGPNAGLTNKRLAALKDRLAVIEAEHRAFINSRTKRTNEHAH